VTPERPERGVAGERDAAAPAGSAPTRRAATAGGDDVPSPCVSICEVSPRHGLCVGCFRTLDEIAAWSVLDPTTKRAIVDALPARRAAVR
jgi:hypothetical protein